MVLANIGHFFIATQWKMNYEAQPDELSKQNGEHEIDLIRVIGEV